MKLLASYDIDNRFSYLLNSSQQDIKHVGVCGSSANFPAKILPVSASLRYVYVRSYVCMGTSAKLKENSHYEP
ncbi:hypothetical protein RclHR1_17070003 [Rhizophagus clarus]|uniref:Uncharacterized protein n=1 Tax=Rhizophagus clarus TaxID=94130 RepID=A0A2Z6QY40_9GLOM|nr:hypothetical protein RclHR1_17070003 [Rhizophagus clarus]GES74833.1 hypothetical protein RCL_e4788_RclHR1_17070003 [Rhizophagus clarus]